MQDGHRGRAPRKVDSECRFDRPRGKWVHAMEEDRSLHAVCKLNTALGLMAGKQVRVPQRAFPAYRPSRLARGLQMFHSALNLPRSFARGRAIVSGQSLAYMSGELEYSRDHVARRAMHHLFKKQPFFIVSGDPAVSLSSQIGCDGDLDPKLRFSSQCVVIIKANYRGIPAVFRVGGCEEARAEIARQTNGIRVAAFCSELQNLVPQIFAHSSDASGLEISVERLLPGSNVQFSWKRVDAVLELWFAGQKTSGSRARPFLEQEVARVCDSWPVHGSALSMFKDSLLEWHSSLAMPGSIAHGDLWLGNVLFSGDAVSGIIDWEWAHENGFRVVDALQLLLMSYSVYRNTSIAQTLRNFWADTIDDPDLVARLNEVRNNFRVHRNDLKFAALILWFDYLRERLTRGRMPSAEWTADMIPHTIPVITRWLQEKKRIQSEAAA